MENNYLNNVKDLQILNGEKNTKAEADGLKAANALYILGIVAVCLIVIVGFILAIIAAKEASHVVRVSSYGYGTYEDTDAGAGIKTFFVSFIPFIIYAIVTYIFTIVGRSVLVLLVNISATQKRMEIISDERNLEQKIDRLKEKAVEGNAEAQYKLGLAYCNGEDVEKDHAEAVKWFTKAAEQGHAQAQFSLGVCYYNGEGVEKDISQAVKLFTKSAEQGNAEAMCKLGVCYEKGEGVKQDPSEAVKWLTRAEEQRSNEASEWLLRAIEQGHNKEVVEFFVKFVGEGKVNVNEDVVKILRKSAEEGNAEAQYALGVCYQKGIGVTQNPYEAGRLLRMAAEQGHERAKEKLKEI